MLKVLIVITILFYISLFLELFIYSIPSVVATKKILYPNIDEPNYFSENVNTILNWSYTQKLLVFVLPMVFIYLLHFLPAYYAYDYNFNSKALSLNAFIFYLGIGLVILGRVISHLYLLRIKKIKAKSFSGFVVSGLFKLSRNPGLVGLYISFLGFLIINQSPLFLICFLIYMIHMHYKVKMEEDYLANKHLEAYKQYLQKTRRYL